MRLIDLVSRHPEFEWEWIYLSVNPNITIKDINEHPELPWVTNVDNQSKHDLVSCKEKLSIESIESIEAHPEKDWNWFDISSSMDIQVIESDLERSNPLPWDWTGISMNPTITIEFVKKYLDILLQNDESTMIMYFISSNYNITTDDIIANPDMQWDWCGVSGNPNVTVEFIDEHPEIQWDIDFLSMNPSITVDYIENHLDLIWSWDHISENKFQFAPFFTRNQYNYVLK
jgi:hypothetical protein